MLLLEPGPKPRVWVAASAHMLLYYAGGVTRTMRLAGGVIPVGWKRVVSESLALALERGKYDRNAPYLEDE